MSEKVVFSQLSRKFIAARSVTLSMDIFEAAHMIFVQTATMR